ncbi:hypothetical protein KY46_16425 [Photobacterium halotolerans]|uniref:Uncharacterized protein n=1 Tax=Photobacterium halotolerans TaxID=265726 RepID=A0A0F5VBM6_9GAMM|nr:hypothetical protein KY46_16425 [Photobacterium halotolerans]
MRRIRFLWLGEYVALEFGGLLGIHECAPDTLYGDKECPENPFCSLVWSGPVVGAPGADNLKIRPEFFPGGVPSMFTFSPSILRQAGIHAASTILWLLFTR